MTLAAPAPTRRRDWRIAVALSVLPGLGQAYNGQIVKGLRLFVATVGLISASTAILLWAIGAGPDVYNSLGLLFLLLAMGSIVVFLAGFIAGLWVWASAVIDAHHSAIALGSGENAERTTIFRL